MDDAAFRGSMVSEDTKLPSLVRRSSHQGLTAAVFPPQLVFNITRDMNTPVDNLFTSLRRFCQDEIDTEKYSGAIFAQEVLGTPQNKDTRELRLVIRTADLQRWVGLTVPGGYTCQEVAKKAEEKLGMWFGEHVLRLPESWEYLHPKTLLLQYNYINDRKHINADIVLILELYISIRRPFKVLPDVTRFKEVFQDAEMELNTVMKKHLDQACEEAITMLSQVLENDGADLFKKQVVSRRRLIGIVSSLLHSLDIWHSVHWTNIKEHFEFQQNPQIGLSDFFLNVQRFLNAYLRAIESRLSLELHGFIRQPLNAASESDHLCVHLQTIRFNPTELRSHVQISAYESLSVIVNIYEYGDSVDPQSKYSYCCSLSSIVFDGKMCYIEIDKRMYISLERIHKFEKTAYLRFILYGDTTQILMLGDQPLFGSHDATGRRQPITDFTFVSLWPSRSRSKHPQLRLTRNLYRDAPLLALDIAKVQHTDSENFLGVAERTGEFRRSSSHAGTGARRRSRSAPILTENYRNYLWRTCQHEDKLLLLLHDMRPFSEEYVDHLKDYLKGRQVTMVTTLAVLRLTDDVFLDVLREDLLALSSAEFLAILPQIVQATKLMPEWESPVVFALLARALACPRVANELYWQIMVEKSVCKQEFKMWFEKLMQVLKCSLGIHMGGHFTNQEEFIQKLESWKYSENCNSVEEWFRTNSLFLPNQFGVEVVGLDRTGSKIMASHARPLMLTLVTSLDTKVKLLFKIGDDLRQDMIIQGLLRLLNFFWANPAVSSQLEPLDINLMTYGVIALSENKGFIEIVGGAQTIRQIQDKHGSDHNVRKFIAEEGDAAMLPMEAFFSSCAGFTVASYLFGLADRHPDNIMIQGCSGQLFHIDFSKALGIKQTFVGVNRDQEVYFNASVKNAVLRDNSMKEFKQFLSDALSIVRDRWELLFIYLDGLQHNGVVTPEKRIFLDERLRLSESNPEVGKDLAKIVDTATNSIKRMIDDSIHARVAHYNENVLRGLNAELGQWKYEEIVKLSLLPSAIQYRLYGDEVKLFPIDVFTVVNECKVNKEATYEKCHTIHRTLQHCVALRRQLNERKLPVLTAESSQESLASFVDAICALNRKLSRNPTLREFCTQDQADRYLVSSGAINLYTCGSKYPT